MREYFGQKAENATTVKVGVPSIVKRGLNLAASLRAWRNAGYRLVKRKEAKRRLSICKGCDFLTGNTCRYCGCNMKLKVWLAGMVCKAPDDKWK